MNPFRVINSHPSQGDTVASWKTPLPRLGKNEVIALTDLLQAWSRGASWRVHNRCDHQLTWRYAERHGLGGVIGSLAMSGRLDDEGIASLAIPRYLSNCLRYEQSLILCEHIEKVARDLGIVICFVKGPTLIPQAYHDSGIRSYSDIDIVLPSSSEVAKLLEALGLPRDAMKEASRGFKRRLLSPGKVHAFLRGWELEFSYLIRGGMDPLSEFLYRHALPTICGRNEGRLSTLDPNAHLILLVQHLATHMCSRLIWFCDIAAFIRCNKEKIDFLWIQREIEQLQIQNMASAITQFCSTYIDGDLPVIRPCPASQIYKLQQTMALPKLIAMRDYSVRPDSFLKKCRFYLLWFVGFFFLADPYRSCSGTYLASKWMVGRLSYALKLKNRGLRALLAVPIRLLLPLVGNIIVFLLSVMANKEALQEDSPNELQKMANTTQT
jgi:hypothetical protein